MKTKGHFDVKIKNIPKSQVDHQLYQSQHGVRRPISLRYSSVVVATDADPD